MQEGYNFLGLMDSSNYSSDNCLAALLGRSLNPTADINEKNPGKHPLYESEPLLMPMGADKCH